MTIVGQNFCALQVLFCMFWGHFPRLGRISADYAFPQKAILPRTFRPKVRLQHTLHVCLLVSLHSWEENKYLRGKYVWPDGRFYEVSYWREAFTNICSIAHSHVSMPQFSPL